MTKVFFKGNKVSFALTMFFTVIQSVVALTLSLILKEMMNTISGTENAKSLPEIAMMIGTFFIAFTVLYIALACKPYELYCFSYFYVTITFSFSEILKRTYRKA